METEHLRSGALYLLAHTVIAALLILSIWALQFVMEWLWGNSGLTLFKGSPLELPVRWLFQANELLILLFFVFSALGDIYHTIFKRQR
jgi:hypothetical protein